MLFNHCWKGFYTSFQIICDAWLALFLLDSQDPGLIKDLLEVLTLPYFMITYVPYLRVPLKVSNEQWLPVDASGCKFVISSLAQYVDERIARWVGRVSLSTHSMHHWLHEKIQEKRHPRKGNLYEHESKRSTEKSNLYLLFASSVPLDSTLLFHWYKQETSSVSSHVYSFSAQTHMFCHLLLPLALFWNRESRSKVVWRGIEIPCTRKEKNNHVVELSD